MQNPQISIIIPVYNVGKYLDDCIESVLGQTFQDYEIICVDDGSSDNSLVILNKYKEKFAEKIHIYSQENQGQSVARNIGVQMAIGKYIVFIDADDIILQDYLEVLYNSAIDNESDMVICSYVKFDNSGNIVLQRNSKDWMIEFKDGLTHVFQYSPCGKLISRDMLIKNDIRFIPGEKMEDGPYGIITNSVVKNIVVLDYYGYRYRVYSESTMGGIRANGISLSRTAQKFPVRGIEYAIKKVHEIRVKEYDEVLEFVVLKAIAGFVFVFAKKEDKATHKAICEYADYIIKKYFPGAKSNPYIRRRIKKLPFSHWMAVRLLVDMNGIHILYPFARLYKIISK